MAPYDFSGDGRTISPSPTTPRRTICTATTTDVHRRGRQAGSPSARPALRGAMGVDWSDARRAAPRSPSEISERDEIVLLDRHRDVFLTSPRLRESGATHARADLRSLLLRLRPDGRSDLYFSNGHVENTIRTSRGRRPASRRLSTGTPVTEDVRRDGGRGLRSRWSARRRPAVSTATGSGHRRRRERQAGACLLEPPRRAGAKPAHRPRRKREVQPRRDRRQVTAIVGGRPQVRMVSTRSRMRRPREDAHVRAGRVPARIPSRSSGPTDPKDWREAWLGTLPLDRREGNREAVTRGDHRA